MPEGDRRRAGTHLESRDHHKGRSHMIKKLIARRAAKQLTAIYTWRPGVPA